MAETYKFYGTKNRNLNVGRVVVEGTLADPKRELVVGGEAVELSEEEVESLREQGYLIRKSGSSSDEAEPHDQGDKS
jgi:hypothetical protein